jgi:hypothetical protein
MSIEVRHIGHRARCIDREWHGEYEEGMALGDMGRKNHEKGMAFLASDYFPS